MNIVFISNYLNNHQIPLCNAICGEVENFCFLQTEKMTEERLKLGWRINENEYPYLVDSSADDGRTRQIIEGADVIILGDTDVNIYSFNMKPDVLILYYRERLFKKSNRVSAIKLLWLGYKYRFKGRKYNKALLCASAYASYDFSRLDAFCNRRYKWGYFPETKDYDIDSLLSGKDYKKILWVGRFIDWKRTSDALKLARRLVDGGYSFELDLVGTGELEEELKQEAEMLGLGECVRFVGSLPQSEVRCRMEKSGVLLITSDHNEGWGAVLNEGMNSALGVVVSHGVGAAPYMIKNGENGFVYECGNIDDMYRKVTRLLEDTELARKMGRAAYATVSERWNEKNAAKRLVSLAESLKRGEEPSFEGGILSEACILENDWIKSVGES